MSIIESDIVKFQNDFGENLKRIRLLKNLTQLDLATICDVETTTISRIENARTNITLKTIYKLSEELEMKPFKLFKFN